MVLNYIWIAFFLIAFVVALMRLVFLGDTQVFPEIINSTFSSSKTAFEISLGLTGVLSLWLGIMRIGEQGGVIALFSRLLGPLFSKLFPDIPKGHPVTGSIFMNLAANMLGLDNAALILSGDLSFNGEKTSHEELAGKLFKLQEQGIPVLVLPGNHDKIGRASCRERVFRAV